MLVYNGTTGFKRGSTVSGLNKSGTVAICNGCPLLYGLLMLAGILALGVLPPLLLEWRRKPDWKASGSAGTAG